MGQGGDGADGHQKAPEKKLGEVFALVTGVCALQGVVPTAQRAAIVVGVELPVYDITKKHLIVSGLMGDTIFAHFV
ncbi:brain mitochondrial carrier protein 1 [Limosa lapponica baueri]|uniref:Brain mitochondrial carrier protein 1 n=1 Tax=Limosa lapponica baueri TaxID=1758121 RepID=A0A2I0T5K0_LIMLA|nr:brain mitochondrial carrier protein 1 [Limosa lapponica baueri]